MVLRYATASQYIAAVTASGLSIFPTRGHSDFFPLVYVSDDHGKRSAQVWSGFYSSRPVLKGMSYAAESWLRASEALFAVVRASKPSVSGDQALFDSVFSSIEQARWDASIVLHHDAITGSPPFFFTSEK
jgi:hypothetical protein